MGARPNNAKGQLDALLGVHESRSILATRDGKTHGKLRLNYGISHQSGKSATLLLGHAERLTGKMGN